MPSFSKLSTFPVGFFRTTASWLLKNRRDVMARVGVINAEVARIGFVKVTYEAKVDSAGNLKRTENPIGVSVTQGSSLAKLMQAYLAGGGNPLSISPFWHPDMTEVIEDPNGGAATVKERYPHGGVLAPKSADYTNPAVGDPEDTGYGSYQGGWVNSQRLTPRRQGGHIDKGMADHDTVVWTMRHIRDWANQEIKERLQDMEARIIKLCDLREQLVFERDEVLTQAFGGALAGLAGEFDDDRHVRGQLVQNLVEEMNRLLFVTGTDGAVVGYRANDDKVPFLHFTFKDEVPEELL